MIFLQRSRCVVLAGVLVLAPLPAVAQAPAPPPVATAPLPNPTPAASPAPVRETGVLDTIGHWFAQQSAGLQAGWQSMTAQVQNFGREAKIVAKTGADGAKQAAGAVAGLSNTRVVNGHERCGLAANGAPDCQQAVLKLCRTQGLSAGSSLEMTAAEDCPAKVYLAGRNSGPECTSYTFVSRALCQ